MPPSPKTINPKKPTHNNRMASIVPDAINDKIHAVKQTVMGTQGDKLADLSKATVEPSNSTHFTSDYGVKGPTQGHDHWLSVTNDKHTGPALLEDTFGREKVSRHLQVHHQIFKSLT